MMSPNKAVDKTMAPVSIAPSGPILFRKESHKGVFFPKTNVPEGKMLIIVPNMFTSFMSLPPVINPHYLEVKAESEVWISEKLNASERLTLIIAKADFSLFCSIAAPHAGKAELRTMCDWGNWVFPYDDMFDNGELRDDPATSRKIMDNLLSIMNEGSATREPMGVLIQIHDTVWNRISKASSKDIQDRFHEAMAQYCDGALEVVDRHASGKMLDLQGYMDVRRRSAGVTPLIAMLEYAHKIDIPNSVYEHHSFEELKRICADVIGLQNDILSYPKEEAEGVTHNIIALLRAEGMTTQQAFDHAGEMLQQCYRDWYLAQAELPQVNEAIDIAIQKYVEGVRSIMQANLNWSFKSERYLGLKMNSLARKYRTILVLKHPQEKALDIKSCTRA